MESTGAVWLLVQSLAMLGVVCVLAWLVIRYGLRRLHPQGGTSKLMRVVARLPLEPRRTLYVVEVAGKTLLIGTGENGGTSLVTELEPEAVRRSLAAEPERRSFADVLRGRIEPAEPDVTALESGTTARD